MDAVAEAALEAVPVEQGQEELEVLLLAVVRRRRHQQEVAGQAREELPQAVPFRVLDLAAEERGRQLVGLVAHDQVPARVRRLQLLLHLLVARQLVQTGDDQVGLEEPVAGAGGFELVVGQDLERKLESAVQLVLPLLGEAAGADDQAPLQVAAGDQLLDQQPRHDGLARAGVVGEQEAQRLARQHRVVDAGDLVRQRVDHRRVDRQQRVEQVREADALRLRHQPEQRAVAVEAPRPPLGDDLEPGLVVAVEQFVGDRAGLRLVGQLERFRAEPLHADDRDQAVGMHATDGATGLQVFKPHGPNNSCCGIAGRPFRNSVMRLVGTAHVGSQSYPVSRNAAAACQRSQSAWMPIQNSGDISNNRASRSAVSAVIPRRPRTTSFKRFNGIFMRRAAST